MKNIYHVKKRHYEIMGETGQEVEIDGIKVGKTKYDK